jgi:hypothetical protein
MPAKKANPNRKTTSKGKATARQNATKRVAERRGSPGKVSVRGTDKEVSQSRYPGETPLTGEDRPMDRPGGKKGEGSGRKG